MDLFKRGMQAFLQRPFSQWPFESSNERKVQKCSEPELYVSNGQDEYTSKSQSTFVIINEDGRRCPAILLTREDSEEIKELLQHAREQLVKQKQAEAEVAARQTLRERLLLQLRSLETRQAQAIYHRCLEAEAEARDQKQVLLEDLERLDLLDQACGASQHKHESGHSEAYTEVLTTLNCLYERANLICPFAAEN